MLDIFYLFLLASCLVLNYYIRYTSDILLCICTIIFGVLPSNNVFYVIAIAIYIVINFTLAYARYYCTINRELLSESIFSKKLNKQLASMDYSNTQRSESLEKHVEKFNNKDYKLYQGAIKKHSSMNGGYYNKQIFLGKELKEKELDVFTHEYSHHLVRTYPYPLSYFGKKCTLFEEKATDILASKLSESKGLDFDKFTYISRKSSVKFLDSRKDLQDDIKKLLIHEQNLGG